MEWTCNNGNTHTEGDKGCAICDMAIKLARLQAKYDALAAENRMMREVLVFVGHTQACSLVYEYDETPEADMQSPPRNCDCAVGAVLTQPHTAREVERVKALEAVVEAARIHLLNGHSGIEAENYTHLCEGESVLELVKSIAALDAGKEEE